MMEEATQLWTERAALALATVLTAFTLAQVPSWQEVLLDPCRQAAVAAGITIVLLYVTRLRGRRGIAFERRLLAAFLIAMPLVYIASWLTTGGNGADRAWLWIEVIGLPAYAGLAVLGLRRSPWFLAAGIAGHGIAWDAWHLGSPYIPTWYAIGCLVVDVGLALYVATRIPAWRRTRRGDA
jgi:hypothetical protein